MTGNFAAASYKGLPVGDPDFKEIIERNFYYADKTVFIKKILKEDSSKALLIARPRCFGKSLLLNTFYRFLKINPEDPDDTSAQDSIFKDTAIYQDKEFCKGYMGKFPVISISLQNVDAASFAIARTQIALQIATVASRLQYLLDSPLFSDVEKENFALLQDFHKLGSDEYQDVLRSALRILTDMLYRYYGRQVIVLIDKYDIPLVKAFGGGYYKDMFPLIKGMLSSSLKDNTALFKGVFTGCLRVAMADMFAGFDNFDTSSVTNDTGALAECMGLTCDEVHTLLNYCHLTEYEDALRHWYGGYDIAGKEIFCTQDVINFCHAAIEALQKGKAVPAPQSLWADCSYDDVISSNMFSLGDSEFKHMQTLLDGGEIEFSLKEKINCSRIGDFRCSGDFWSFLLYTGYLTATAVTTVARQGTNCRARIPNAKAWQAFKAGVFDRYKSFRVQDFAMCS